jgi:NAD(P)-dependent dehydrogenase (short-subunit alcohol dehydrogenase family)
MHCSASLDLAVCPYVDFFRLKNLLTSPSSYVAMDLKAFGIRVNQVSPVWVKTPMFEEECRRVPPIPDIVKKIIPAERPMAPDEVASAIQFLCGPSSVFIHGTGLLIDAGMLLGPVFV